MIYLDTGVLVSALFLRDEKQAECQALITSDAATSTHALAETFATLTGQYRLKNDIVSASVLSAAAALRVSQSRGPTISGQYGLHENAVSWAESSTTRCMRKSHAALPSNASILSTSPTSST
jgi:predicted nucleic acid-binding protein